MEIRRRLYVLQNDALKAQMAATEAQKEAIAVMERQASFMFWSVVGIFATAVITLISAFISNS